MATDDEADELAAAQRLAAALDGADPEPGSPDERTLLGAAELLRATAPGSEDPALLAAVRNRLPGSREPGPARRPHPRFQLVAAAAALLLAVGIGWFSGLAAGGPRLLAVTPGAAPEPLQVAALRSPRELMRQILHERRPSWARSRRPGS